MSRHHLLRVGAAVISVFAVLAACAAPIAEPSPTPAAPSPPPGGTPSPSPTAAASPTPTAEPTAEPPASPTPTTQPTAPAGWVSPERISTRNYDELDLVIDNDGIAHAAAELNDAIFYLTNASGSWTRERVSSPIEGGSDRQPSIAYDAEEGYLAIAFTRYGRYECFELGCYPAGSTGIFVVTNYAGTWSSPFAVTGRGTDYPSLRTGNGQLHLAYERTRGDTISVHHATDSGPGPEWVDVTIAEGHSPKLQVGSDGLPHIAFIDESVSYASASSSDGPFSAAPVPGVAGWPDLLLDGTNRPHIVYTSWEDPWSILHTAWNGTSWSTPDRVMANQLLGEAAIDSAGALHITYNVSDTVDEDDEGLWYATNRGGSYTTRQLDRSIRFFADGPGAAAALALDGGGRPHFLFSVIYPDSRSGLYYGIGPGD